MLRGLQSPEFQQIDALRPCHQALGKVHRIPLQGCSNKCMHYRMQEQTQSCRLFAQESVNHDEKLIIQAFVCCAATIY